jgi:2-keto-4-pentenoate hydratase/2-oxohepta-3-ene-1,7-dioic acid hydratase in catechol pathway
MTIFCVARNYVAHAREMNNPVPETPVIFMKPLAALLTDNQPFHLPAHSSHVDYETEIVVRLSDGGRFIPESRAGACYDQATVGIDFTARDVQNRCKDKGWPWEIAKAFDQSAALGPFHPKDALGRPFHELGFTLAQNGTEVQRGQVSDMLFSVEYLISYISSIFTLSAGDIIFTGTPFGVGAVHAGDVLEASIEGRKLLTCEVRNPITPTADAD